MKILYAVSEATPFAKTGGLADVAGSLPRALCAEGTDTRVIMPLYGSIATEWLDKMEFCLHTYVHLGWRKQYCGLYELKHNDVTYYFVDNEYYFKRSALYGHMDDGERFGFFARAVIELLPLINWKPDVINCNDWQTALIPIYAKLEAAEFYEEIKTVFTIHNIEYQGKYSLDTALDVFGLPKHLYDSGILRYDGGINLMKAAIYQADFVTTVSPSYAHELRDPYFACGLHLVIAENFYKFVGILNGIDTQRYNPRTDKTIAKKYSAKDMSGKIACKKALCNEIGFDADDPSPIIACVSRLVGHKGFDLVADALDTIVAKNARLIILGTGDDCFENRFREGEARYKGRVSANIMYSEKRAMAIYSGADLMLMPSRSEPCGLTQMIAMRYGTLPIVRKVGGLSDSVRNYRSENSNGFSFGDYTIDAMLGAVSDALITYEDKEEWSALMHRAMTDELSWNRSAKEYLSIYNQLTNK